METNNNKLAVFSNPDFGEVRTLVKEDGSVLFCGKDVATALGYKDTVNALKAHCKGVAKHPLPTNGGKQEFSFIPEVDKTYSATEAGEIIGVSAAKIGRVANANGIKTEDFEIFVLDKAKGSNKQVTTFRYNEKGLAKLRELFSE